MLSGLWYSGKNLVALECTRNVFVRVDMQEVLNGCLEWVRCGLINWSSVQLRKYYWRMTQWYEVILRYGKWCPVCSLLLLLLKNQLCSLELLIHVALMRPMTLWHPHHEAPAATILEPLALPQIIYSLITSMSIYCNLQYVELPIPIWNCPLFKMFIKGPALGAPALRGEQQPERGPSRWCTTWSNTPSRVGWYWINFVLGSGENNGLCILLLLLLLLLLLFCFVQCSVANT